MPKDRKKSQEKRFSVEEYLKKRAALRLLDLPPEERMDRLSELRGLSPGTWYLDGDPPVLSYEKPSWKSNKPAGIIGQPLKDFDDLVDCAQGWKNPECEKLRYVYIRDSEIVDSEGVTSHRTVGKDALIEDTREGIRHMKERIAALDVDSVFMIHNHPSGDSTPVATDRDLAIRLRKMVPELRAHIVINSGWFGLITLDGLAILCILPDIPSDSFYPLLTGGAEYGG